MTKEEKAKKWTEEEVHPASDVNKAWARTGYLAGYNAGMFRAAKIADNYTANLNDIIGMSRDPRNKLISEDIAEDIRAEANI